MSRVPGWGWETPPGAAQLIRAHFGASKCVSERQNAFRSVKMHFGASKCISERQNAFRSVKMHFGASKCISERQNAFRSVGVGGGLLRFEFRIGSAASWFCDDYAPCLVIPPPPPP